MAIEKIDQEKCTGCCICVNTCPADVLRLDEEKKKAYVAYPEDCAICRWCLYDCPKGAIIMTAEKQIPFITSMG